MHDQYPSGGEFVSAEELARVLELGRSWLMEHGHYDEQNGAVTNELNNLPVISFKPSGLPPEIDEILRLFQQPYYEAVIPRRILDSIAAGVSKTLGLSDNLRLSYFVACYEFDENGELEFCPPSLLIDIPKPSGGEITQESFLIVCDEDGRTVSEREVTTRQGGEGEPLRLSIELEEARKTGEISESVKEYLSAKIFAEQTGLGHITQQELDAVEQTFIALRVYGKR